MTAAGAISAVLVGVGGCMILIPLAVRLIGAAVCRSGLHFAPPQDARAALFYFACERCGERVRGKAGR